MNNNQFASTINITIATTRAVKILRTSIKPIQWICQEALIFFAVSEQPRCQAGERVVEL
jgi:hypothetical protein